MALYQWDNPASSDSARIARSHRDGRGVDPNTIPDALGQYSAGIADKLPHYPLVLGSNYQPFFIGSTLEADRQLGGYIDVRMDSQARINPRPGERIASYTLLIRWLTIQKYINILLKTFNLRVCWILKWANWVINSKSVINDLIKYLAWQLTQWSRVHAIINDIPNFETW